jgi:hypothetical protein
MESLLAKILHNMLHSYELFAALSTYFMHIPNNLALLTIRIISFRRPGFDSQHYQKKKVVVLERGPLSLVSTTEELLDRKVAAPV